MNLLRKHSIPIGFGLLIVFFFMLQAARIIDLGFGDRMEALSYDLRLKITLPETHDTRIVIVDIDEKSLAHEGRWPWSRNKLSRLTDNLFRHGAAVVAYDMVFAERDESSGWKVLEGLQKKELKSNPAYQATLSGLKNRLDYDGAFCRSIKGKPVVLGYYFNNSVTTGKAHTSGQLPTPAFSAGRFKSLNIPFVEMSGYGANLNELQQNACNAGHFNNYPDLDGVTRRIPMLIEYDGAYYEAFSLAVVRALFGNPPLVSGLARSGNGDGDYNRIEWLGVCDLRIPVDERVAAYVPYRGRQGSFTYLSASDVLHERVNPDRLKGSIVLVGTTSPGLMDARSTPVAAVYPGVEVHANMIAGILDQTLRHKPAYAMGAEVLILLFVGLALSFALPLLGPFASASVSVSALACVAGGNLWAWGHDIVMPLASAVTMICLIAVFNMSYGFFVEARAKRRITGLFSQYVPKEIVAEMSKNPRKYTMEGESRELTVLFSDVRDFTTISEPLSPTELSKLMNEYLSAMTSVIQKHAGTIDKYIGDAIMAFWGAPVNNPSHAQNGVLAAIEMQKAIVSLGSVFVERGWPELTVGIGLSTGPMRVGNMGSRFRMAYTVMGDAVNLGSRLEGLTKEYGVGIIVSEQTRNAARDIVFGEIDRVFVKGRREAVTIYQALGRQGEVDESVLAEISWFEQALRHYRSGEWDRAEAILQELLEGVPQSRLYHLYMARIARFGILREEGVLPQYGT